MTNKCAVAMVVLAACTSNPGTAKDFFSDLQSAECDVLVACNEMPNKAACTSALTLNSFDVLTIEADVTKGTVKYDESVGGDCIDAFQGASCNYVSLEKSFVSCTKVFTGTAAQGGACNVSEECQNNGSCSFTGGCVPELMCCTGTCDVPTIAPIGGDCTTAVCADGSFCAQATMKCTAVITTAGAACMDDGACALPLICAINPSTQMGTCAMPVASGASCATVTTCADIRDYCDNTTMLCTRQAAIGQACSDGGVECQEDADCVSSMCVARGKVNDPCSTTSGASCLEDLTCTNSVCVAETSGMACP